MKFKLPLLLISLIGAILVLATTSSAGCFSVIVGREASADGYVIVAHNEDDGPPQVVHHRKVERRTFAPGDSLTLVGGARIEQPVETWAYLWSQMPGMKFSDSFLNEWGVCVTSDNCPSREDRPDLSGGGISYDLRHLVAQRARTAREGVILAGQLVERFGYDASGRTYIICDPYEGWLFCAVHGTHWLAQRVPDDHVAMLSNTYSVRRVNLQDKENVLASRDIVKYAQKRGWYDTQRDGEFDFARAYANPDIAADSANFCRQWSGLRHVTEPLPLTPDLPFSVKPRQKLDAALVAGILRDHYEWAELYRSWEGADPHTAGVHPICNNTTQTSFIAQLRADRPAGLGLVWWICQGPPCASPFLPVYYGAGFPPGWDLGGGPPLAEEYEAQVERFSPADPREAFWSFSRLNQEARRRFGARDDTWRRTLASVEENIRALQGPVEQTAGRLHETDPEAAAGLLRQWTTGLYLTALDTLSRELGAGMVSKSYQE
ncbi:MAG: hypothetical protein C4524_06895 [Candidatus Zixiibacteriota bacterium]|nr:MAG: hypothetical protein C4524_06895 [candidate division Zixibacteria bacterium]